MSVDNQDRLKALEIVKNSPTAPYSNESAPYTEAFKDEELSTDVKPLSALEELSLKIEMCLKKQKQVNFISREISEIVKKSS
jgi:hypothetical protein